MSENSEEKIEKRSQPKMPFSGKRIIVCGKGGSGKSSMVCLMATIFSSKGYRVLVLDGDASNPGGLARLMFGMDKGPKPLMEFFGGREKVLCPVDDPAPLTRIDEALPITENNMDVAEIPAEYFIEKEGILLFQVGKTERFGEGCDGPMSKITRDFIVKGNQITLIDVEAGIEHFGRGVEKNVDIILVVTDPTCESFLIAEKVTNLSREMGLGHKQVWAILNKVQSKEMQSMMLKELKNKKVNSLGTVFYDSEIINAGLMGIPFAQYKALGDARKIVERLEKTIQE